MKCKIGDDGSWNQIAGRIPANLPAFTDYGLKSGQKYTYRLRTFNAAGVSNWSNEVTAKTKRQARFRQKVGQKWETSFSCWSSSEVGPPGTGDVV